MGDKPIYWIGTSREDIRDFPEDAKRKAGFQLRAIQQGEKLRSLLVAITSLKI